MSVTSVLNTSLSALQASQTALGVVSKNIANANTPGYVRAEVNLQAREIGGVDVASIKRAANRFLAAATWNAHAANGSATARADLMDRAQAAFGDPNSDNTIFSSIDDAFASLQTLAVNPTSVLERSNAIASLQRLFSDISAVGAQIEDLRIEADQRIGEAAELANGYLKEIAARNLDVARIKVSGGDVTGAENARDAVLDKLAELIDIRVQPADAGMVEVRTPAGAFLARGDAAAITYDHAQRAYGEGGVLLLNAGQSSETQLEPVLKDGAIKGLITARDVDLVQLGDALGEFAGVLADALNEVHATTVGSPPSSRLVGRQTGLLGTDAHNFTGVATLGVVDADGELVQRIRVDFDVGEVRSEGPSGGVVTTPIGGATIDDVIAALDTALGDSPSGSAVFQNGILTLTGGSGLIFGDAGGTESDRGGRSFAHFFGVNDLVRSDAPSFFAAGVSAGDQHGLTAGGEIAFRVRDALGRVVAERTIAPTGPLWSDLISDINDTATGVGQFITASIPNDGQGRLQLSGVSGFRYEIMGDTTQRTGTGISVSALFGLDRSATAGRAQALRVNPDISAEPGRLGLGRPDVEALLNTRVIEAGDSRGAQALAAAKNLSHNFAPVAGVNGGRISLTQYASTLAGLASNSASAAEKARDGAQIVLKSTSERRAQAESVSMDDELLKMTQYQQSYAAAARLMQAARDMFDTLISLV